MNRRTKALAIPRKVKDVVWARDGGCCILCGSPDAAPNAHYISRAHSGLGVEQNIVTLCADCHRRYDQSTERAEIKEDIREYLMMQYSDWDEEKLVYQKYGG